MSLLDGRCAAPQNPKPGVTTFFCVYAEGHDGTHSWEDDAETRRAKRSAAEPSSGPEES